MTPITVYVIAGRDRQGRWLELAKFFTRADAEKHLERYPRTSPAVPYIDVGIGQREEALEEQHESHRAFLKPTAKR